LGFFLVIKGSNRKIEHRELKSIGNSGRQLRIENRDRVGIGHRASDIEPRTKRDFQLKMPPFRISVPPIPDSNTHVLHLRGVVAIRTTQVEALARRGLERVAQAVDHVILRREIDHTALETLAVGMSFLSLSLSLSHTHTLSLSPSVQGC